MGLLATTHVTIPDAITFAVSAILILAGAVGVVTARNPVHAALMLVMTLFGVAVLFVAQEADFLAVVQVIVYAGAIVVLFLFVIMFLGVDRKENVEAEPLRGQRPLALVLIVIIAGCIIALGVNAHWVTGAHHVAGARGTAGDNVNRLGRSVFTTYLLAFEITAALLVIAVVGAVVLARRPSSPALDDEEPEPEAEAAETDGSPPDPEATDPAPPPVSGEVASPEEAARQREEVRR